LDAISMPSEDSEMITGLREIFGARVRQNHSLAGLSTFGVGGPADALVVVKSEEELLRLFSLTSARAYPLTLVGNRSNMLFSDRGVRGIVACIRLNKFRLEPLDEQHVRLIADPGVSMPLLVKNLASQGIAGLEWAIGVPGTVGGAVVSNAGAQRACVKDTIEHAQVLCRASDGTFSVVEIPKTDLKLGYRTSRFRAGREITFDNECRPLPLAPGKLGVTEIITSASFRLRYDDPEEVQKRCAAYEADRASKQPSVNGNPVRGNVGSIFKNPPGDHAARLVEDVKLKGKVIGGAQISPKHTNFIVNPDHKATAEDIVALITLIRRMVLDRFGVALELEVELRGDW
jgi:UDP-N-acetylmuramate dehydrogenase